VTASLLVACALTTSLDDLASDGGDGGDGGGGGGDGAIPTGQRGGPCFANATCNAGLVCASDTCVDFDGGSSSDGGLDALYPSLLCGSSECDPNIALCCISNTFAICTQTCSSPDYAVTCDDSRQCLAHHDSGKFACCLQPLDSGVPSLCNVGCLQVACNPTAPSCPNGSSCTGVESVNGYSLHYCQ